MDKYLSEILGMEKFTLQPAAGSGNDRPYDDQGLPYHRLDSKRVKIIVLIHHMEQITSKAQRL